MQLKRDKQNNQVFNSEGTTFITSLGVMLNAAAQKT